MFGDLVKNPTEKMLPFAAARCAFGIQDQDSDEAISVDVPFLSRWRGTGFEFLVAESFYQPLWLHYGYILLILWLHYGCIMLILCLYHGYIMVTLWLYDAYIMVIL